MTKLKGSLNDVDSKLKSRNDPSSNYKQIVEAATKSMKEMTGSMNKYGGESQKSTA